MSILVGTASWTDKTLIDCGRFYPKQVRTPEARLRYYASIFPMVEVDSSYYAIPAPNTAQAWAERTPEAFVFNVKAFRLFTGHQTQPQVMHKDIQQVLAERNRPMPRQFYYRDMPQDIRVELWRRFHDALAPLVSAGKLGMVHFQFPPWLVRNRDGMAHVAHCVEQMQGRVCSIEFRHESWFSDAHRADTLEFVRSLRAVHTVVDGPQGFANSVPLLAEATHPDFALIRLHGRNTGSYNVRGASSAAERFDYEYGDAELTELAAEIVRLGYKARNTHVVFNNCDEDKGQRNGISMMKLLGTSWPPG
jgi:uncharacterized protein YecE (DUF72 family)